MSIAPRLDLRQNQTLVMTPQLRQAIQLLQFTNLEAAQFLDEEMERNPFLELGDSDAAGSAPTGVDKPEEPGPLDPAPGAASGSGAKRVGNRDASVKERRIGAG